MFPALKEVGIFQEAFSIVPFPINFPELYQYYVPMDAIFFLSIYDDWGKRKLAYFKSLGLKTHVLWQASPEEKGISANQIREKMINDQPWEHLTPPSVSRLLDQLLKEWQLVERLKDLYSKQLK